LFKGTDFRFTDVLRVQRANCARLIRDLMARFPTPLTAFAGDG
jgi:hypothetical protein